jgi:hypothetical protein
MVDDKIRKDKIRFSSYLVDAHRAHELLANGWRGGQTAS